MSHGQQNLELGPAAYGKRSSKIKHTRLDFEQACGAFVAVSLGQKSRLRDGSHNCLLL